MSQQDIWKNFWKNYNEQAEKETEIKEYHMDLKKIIEDYDDKKNIIEIGCGTGITSLILDEKFNKTLLDYDENILNFSKQLFEQKKQTATFKKDDMFKNSIEDKSYDVVFNSGVMEHYDAETRLLAFKEFERILKDDGCIIIAIPNHYCTPYRVGYLFLNLLNKWPYPKEYKIKNFEKELNKVGLKTEKTEICTKNLLKNSIGNKLFKNLYVIADKIFNFEGYLRVFIIKKRIASRG